MCNIMSSICFIFPFFMSFCVFMLFMFLFYCYMVATLLFSSCLSILFPFFMFWCITSQTVSIVFHLGFLMYCKTQAYIFKDLRSPCLQCLRSERLARQTFITLFSFPCWRLCRSVWLDTSHNLDLSIFYSYFIFWYTMYIMYLLFLVFWFAAHIGLHFFCQSFVVDRFG